MSEIPSKYYSLSQLAKSLQSVIRRTYDKQYWIKAEISRLNFYPKSGHCYPDLVEKDHGKVLAQMRAIIWSRDYFRINADFVKKTGNPLADGMEILFKAKLEYNPTHGFSLMITDISAEFVLGKMALEKKQNLARLKKDGLFYRNKELKFPLLPQRIAIISVETSKGFHDFVNIIENNSRGYKFFWMLFPALLQGDGAVRSIQQQLEQIKRVKHHFDIVAIIRGGGGDVGLSCYDNFDLAEMVAEFELPIISGIGHSTNETLVEMVAHYNPITPTDLAYFLQQKFDNVAVAVDELNQRIVDISKNSLAEMRNYLDELPWRIQKQAQERISEQKHDIEKQSGKLQHKTLMLIQKQELLLERYWEIAQGSINQVLANGPNILMDKSVRLQRATKSLLVNRQSGLRLVEEKIALMKPENLLKKGYSLTMFNGKPLTDINSLKSGDIIQTKLYKGELESSITKIKKR